MVNIASNGTLRRDSPFCSRLISNCVFREYGEAYFDISRGYHAQTTAWEPGWGNSIGSYSLGYSPFCEGFMLFSGPPGWLHFVVDDFLVETDAEVMTRPEWEEFQDQISCPELRVGN